MSDLTSSLSALVVVAPHPDDETLGCGALLHAADAAGMPCRVICITDGAASHPRSRDWLRERLAALRRAEPSSRRRCRFLPRMPSFTGWAIPIAACPIRTRMMAVQAGSPA